MGLRLHPGYRPLPARSAECIESSMSNDRRKQKVTDTEDLTFEQALSRLDETVIVLEAGELPLAEATRVYEQGMKLARICSEMLAAAELKITQIQTAYGEQMRLPREEKPAPEGEP